MEVKYTVDDLCLKYLENFTLFDEIKKEFPKFRLIAFTISNFNNKENLGESKEFKYWYLQHKDWVEIAVHSYDHLYPPDGDRENQEYWIKKAYDNLCRFLPKQYGYRSPGFQTTSGTEGILKKLGFSYIAYETKIKNLITNTIEHGVINSHLYDKKSIYEILQDNIRKRGN